MKWLVTAFEPFAGASTNSSWLVLEHLRVRYAGSPNFVFHGPVPVTFGGAWPFVLKKLESEPALEGVLCLGQAESRNKISLEQVALNYIDARIADNVSLQPARGPVTDGPDLLWSSVSWDQMKESPQIERSYSAGTFVCNSLMYQSLLWAKRLGKKAAFVHFPALASQTEAALERAPKIPDGEAKNAAEEILSFLENL